VNSTRRRVSTTPEGEGDSCSYVACEWQPSTQLFRQVELVCHWDGCEILEIFHSNSCARKARVENLGVLSL